MMARKLEDIKKQMTDAFIGNDAVQSVYGLDVAKNFEEQFSKVSIESILFYVFAYAIWLVESLFDVHKAEVDAMLDNKMSHRKKWYQEKVLRFQYPGRTLIDDKDIYDNTGLSADDIAALEVVKFCAVEDLVGDLKIKVAKGSVGVRTQLSVGEVAGLQSYLEEIRDAGVNTTIINQQADKIFATINVYYNPLILTPTDEPVEAAFITYISTLDFNGLMKRNRLEDNLQDVPGVELVDIVSIETQRAANPKESLGVQKVAESGYWVLNNTADLVINYIPYSHGNI